MSNIVGSQDETPVHVPRDRVIDFNVYAPPGDATTDAFAPFLQLQRSTHAKIIWTPANGGHWIILDGAKIAELLSDSDLLSSRRLTVPPEIGDIARLIPNQIDPPIHRTYRGILNKEFGAKYLMALKEPIKEISLDLINQFRTSGRCEYITQFSEILPIHVFLLLVGLPRKDAQTLRNLASQLSRPDGTMTPQQFLAALDQYLLPFIEERLRCPGEDLLSRILSQKLDGRAWTLDEAQRVCRNIMFAGLDSVSALLGFVTLFLAENQGHQETIRANQRIIPAAADEFIRRFAVVSLGREARRDFEFDGVTIKKHDMLLLPTILRNLDPESFDDPAQVKFDRGAADNSTMGGGIHRCVGAGLARLELMTVLDIWHELIPTFRLDPQGRPSQKAGTIATVAQLPLVWTV